MLVSVGQGAGVGRDSRQHPDWANALGSGVDDTDGM